VQELIFVNEMVEERLVNGDLRWLASFNEIHRDYVWNDIVFPLYASGTLQERGFFLSRIFSALVTPKYKINFFLYTSQEIDPKFLRKMILSCKSKFGPDDWVFLALAQNEPLGSLLKKTITEMHEKAIGIAAYSLKSKESVSSDNVLGRNLAKQIKLTEAKFEAFDWVNYLKSFTIVFLFGIALLVFISFSGLREAIQPLTLLLLAVFSVIIGHTMYKRRYHTTLTLGSKEFEIREGNTVKEGEWSDYDDVAIHITPNREICLRLSGKEKTFDLPISRTRLSRTEAYNTIRQLIKKGQVPSR
jgi:hypothetical protein